MLEAKRPTFSIQLSATRPGSKEYSSDKVEIGVFGIPIDTTDAEILDMCERAVSAEELLRDRLRVRLGEAPRRARQQPQEAYEPTLEEYIRDVEGLPGYADQETGEVYEEPRKHIFRTCSCGNSLCAVCAGLSICSVCNGAEASLPSECPGEWMTANVQDDVQSGRIDFSGGQWITTGPERQVLTDPASIPRAEDIRTTLEAFGVEVRIPSEADYALPITTANDQTAGQLTALNTAMSNAGLQKDRHDSAEILLAAMGVDFLFTEGGKRTFAALSKAQAGVLLDWFGSADDAALSQLREAVAAKKGQGVLA